MDTFNLISVKREGGSGQTSRLFFDYLINGQPLLKQFEGIVEIGGMGSFGEKNDKEFALQLLKRKVSELNSDRVPIYICPECGDLDCGTVTVKISEKEDCFIWSDFGYENNNQEGLSETFRIGTFSFGKEEYQSILSKFLAQ